MTQFKKMDPEIKAKWLEALRSGEYEQGKYSLCSMLSKYCCLGVGCELAVKAGVISAPIKANEYGDWIFDGNAALPSKATMKWLTLDDVAIGPLITMNDDGRPFSEIADWIEENL